MAISAKPNVIVFFTDQQRWDTLGLNGNPDGLTPNFDRLAKQGTFFKNATTCQPVCGPARSCLQTGQYATTTGVWKNGLGLKSDATTLAQCFNESGYRTGYIGKWHLAGPDQPEGPVAKELRAGYQDWLAAEVVELTSGPYSSILWDTENNPVQLPGYRVDGMADAAIRYIHDRANTPEQPYLLFFSLLEPHHQNTDDSYPAPHGYEERYRKAWLPPDLQTPKSSAPAHWPGYCGMVKRIDEALGRMMDAIESLGQLENTIVAFVSDHGCHFKTRNAEYKRTGHESSVRIPLALWGPGFNGGGERHEAASLVDLPATLLGGAGLPIPSTMQGRSLLPLTRNETEHWPKESYIQVGDVWLPPARAIRTERWKYIVVSHGEPAPASGVYSESELYDLQSDPYELTNLIEAEAYTPVTRELRKRLLARMLEIEDQTAEIIEAPKKPSSQRAINYPCGDSHS